MAVNAQEGPGLSARRGEYKTFRVKELHPTFGAEIEVMNCLTPGKEEFDELLQAMAKV